MFMDKNTKKALTDLFKRMLEEGMASGKYGDLVPGPKGYIQTEWKITLTKIERTVND